MLLQKRQTWRALSASRYDLHQGMWQLTLDDAAVWRSYTSQLTMLGTVLAASYSRDGGVQDDEAIAASCVHQLWGH